MKFLEDNQISLFKVYLEDARKFFGLDLLIKARHNSLLKVPAKWVVGETTRNKITIEYTPELMKYPSWAVKSIAFHEICHVKQASRGLPCFFYKTQEETMSNIIEGLNMYELDVKELSNDLGLAKKKTIVIFQMVVVMATDFLTNSELIQDSPVRSNTMSFGIVTVRGNCRMLENRRNILAGIMESGMWDAVWRNVDLILNSDLSRDLGQGIQRVRDIASSYHGLSVKAYDRYVSALSSVEFTTQPKAFFLVVSSVTRAVMPILEDINATIDPHPFEIR